LHHLLLPLKEIVEIGRIPILLGEDLLPHVHHKQKMHDNDGVLAFAHILVLLEVRHVEFQSVNELQDGHAELLLEFCWGDGDVAEE
jgi:hypothetical protein